MIFSERILLRVQSLMEVMMLEEETGIIKKSMLNNRIVNAEREHKLYREGRTL